MSFEPYAIFAILMAVLGVVSGLFVFYKATVRGYFTLDDVIYVFIPFLIALMLLAGGMLVAMLSPSNTPKNTASDRSEIIDNLPAVSSEPAMIRDNTLRPELDPQERAKRFDDMVKY